LPKYGLLIDYGYCVGCHTCEVACIQEHKRPDGEWGIRVLAVESELSSGKRYHIPFPTDKCKLCGKRIARGLMPSCVKHCQSGIIRFGKIEELAKEMPKKPETVLWVPH
jgi:Fe-S-cluster-containing dehydrogenase component